MVIKAICYADDVLLLVKEFRVTEKLLGTSATYFKKSLKLNMDIEKSRVIRVLSIFYFCIEKEQKQDNTLVNAKSEKDQRQTVKTNFPQSVQKFGHSFKQHNSNLCDIGWNNENAGKIKLVTIQVSVYKQ